MRRMGVLLVAVSLTLSARAFADSIERTPLGPSGVAPAAILPFALASLPQLDPKSWQEEYDAAKSKQGRGRALMWIGAGATGLGVLMITKVEGDSTCGFGFCVTEYNYMPSAMVTSAGASLLVWGIMQQGDASNTIRTLERQRPGKTSTGAAITLAGGTSIVVGGRGMSLRHAFTW